MPLPTSSALPPRYVENTRPVPAGFSLVTKTSSPPPDVDCSGLAVGKFDDAVLPVTYALPAASTANPNARSSPLPPRYVRYMTAPFVSSRPTNASVCPPNDD